MDSLPRRAEMAELIEMRFGMWTLVGQSNRVLDGGRDPRV